MKVKIPCSAKGCKSKGERIIGGKLYCQFHAKKEDEKIEMIKRAKKYFVNMQDK